MDETCLELGLGLSEYTQKRDHSMQKIKKRGLVLDLSISHDQVANSSMKISVGGDERQGITNELISNCSKEEDDVNFSNNCSRKKLRLTKDQSVLLEDSFKKHCTLNTAQKHALAEQLNLKPRQVEVWFQNRRARTKLKQTEINCQYLRKNCERLSEENLRLKKELLELQRSSANRTQSSFPYRHKEGASLRKCELCKKIEKGRGGGGAKPEAAAAIEEVVPEAR